MILRMENDCVYLGVMENKYPPTTKVGLLPLTSCMVASWLSLILQVAVNVDALISKLYFADATVVLSNKKTFGQLVATGWFNIISYSFLVLLCTRYLVPIPSSLVLRKTCLPTASWRLRRWGRIFQWLAGPHSVMLL